MVFSDSIDGSVVDKQFQKGLKFQLANSFFIVIDIVAISDLILHIFNLFLGWIESHTSHHIGNSTQGNFSVKFSGFCGMFIF